MSPHTITDAISAPVVSEILRIDGPYGYYYEAYFQGMEDFYLDFRRDNSNDGTIILGGCDLTGEEISPFLDVLLKSYVDYEKGEPLPAVRQLMEAADRRWESGCSTWRAEEQAKLELDGDALAAMWTAKCGADVIWGCGAIGGPPIVFTAEQQAAIDAESARWNVLTAEEQAELTAACAAENAEVDAHNARRQAYRAKLKEVNAGLITDEVFRTSPEVRAIWDRIESEIKAEDEAALALMIPLFQADTASPAYRAMEARLLADFAYRPPVYEGGSRHNFIIAEISRHVGLNPELTDQDIHYSVVKLVDTVEPRFGLPPDRWNRREVEIKDGEKWGRWVRKKNREKAECDSVLIEVRRRLTNRLRNVETPEQFAAILRGDYDGRTD